MESTIISHLVMNEQFARKVIPFIKPEYFHQLEHVKLFELIHAFAGKYNSFPTKEALYIDLEQVAGINEHLFEDCKTAISNIEIDPTTDVNWLVDKTEKFCQNRALYNAIKKSITIVDGSSNDLLATSIPKIMEDALTVSFDTHIGHDFLDDSEARFDMYHRVEDRIDSDLEMLNKVLGGGWIDKTLNCFLAPPGVGKTMVMCHLAAYNLISNKNVLYITNEMAEERIAQRIDANLMGIPLDELLTLSKLEYRNKINKVKQTTKGKLIVKEYPTATAGANHFRHLITELKLKRKFTPDIIYIDYLNICISSRMKMGGSVNSYTYIKSIAEELRGLAIELNLPIITATQANRDAVGSSDLSMDNTSESMGLPATVDFLCGLVATDDLMKLNQMMFVQIKSRYRDYTLNRRFTIGVDRPRMRLYNVEQSAQQDLIDGPEEDSPVMDSTETMRDEASYKFGARKFKGFK